MALPRGIEPLLQPGEGRVLTARRRERWLEGNSLEIGFPQGGPAHGSLANVSPPVRFCVRASEVRVLGAPPISSVTTRRSPATAVETMRAPFGSMEVVSAVTVLPSDRKRR